MSASDCLGRMPVHHAAQAGSKEALDMLIRHRVDINCQAQSNGMTSLHYAAKVILEKQSVIRTLQYFHVSVVAFGACFYRRVTAKSFISC